MKQTHKVEEEDEIGRSKNRKAAKVNLKLAAANRKFGMYHGLSSLANILAFGSLAMHSWYLAGKINLPGKSIPLSAKCRFWSYSTVKASYC